MKKKFLFFILILSLSIACTSDCTQFQLTAKAESVQQNIQQSVFVSVDPLELVKAPNKYLKKNIKMKATFDKFTNLGLDYKPAFRSSQDYISFLILREDVGDNIIPLSEMKLFLTRKAAEKFIELEVGDKIQIEGTVFSSALSDTWIDVSKIIVLEKKKGKKA